MNVCFLLRAVIGDANVLRETDPHIAADAGPPILCRGRSSGKNQIANVITPSVAAIGRSKQASTLPSAFTSDDTGSLRACRRARRQGSVA